MEVDLNIKIEKKGFKDYKKVAMHYWKEKEHIKNSLGKSSDQEKRKSNEVLQETDFKTKQSFKRRGKSTGRMI
jgi:hypothetical protein